MNEPIITITSKAAAHIAKIIAQTPEGKHFRLSIKRTGCTGWMYKPDIVSEPKADDIAVPCDTDFTVFVDPACVDLIKGTELDVTEKELGLRQMVFNNPNVESMCGCGESFNVKSE
ncbi:MAG: iron-sulfur cluster assembly accessory protein [Pseudomonadota bacterium]|nr:iron-sulfur cluster assembly accessory protein [Pseudomonadota bacterium]